MTRPVPHLRNAPLLSVAVCAWLAFALAASAQITIDSVTVAEPADPARVPKYGKIELVVSLSGVAATEFYEPDPARGGLDLAATFTAPGSETWDVKGFYDGSAWRIRFAAGELGQWGYAVQVEDASGTSGPVAGAFTCVNSPHAGWVRLDGRCLRFTEGNAPFAVGHNTGWQPDVEQPALADMAAAGENLLSFWLCMPWAKPSWASPGEPYWAWRSAIENVEDGLGNYNQAACAYIDAMVGRAEQAGVVLLPTIWTHGQLREVGDPWPEGWWDNNPYNTICSVADFFQTDDAGADTEQWRYQQNFCRYLIARWGHSRAIAGWVAVCEIDGTKGYVSHPTQAEAWCGLVRDYFSARDKFRRGPAGEYPMAVSKVDLPAWNPPLDMRATDCYNEWDDDVEVAHAIATQTATMRLSGKASLHAEFGGNLSAGATQPAHMHSGVWAGAGSGAVMAPLLYCDDGNWPLLTVEMQEHLGILADFMAGVDYLDDPALAPAAVAVGEPACRAWGMALSDRGVVWVQKTDGDIGGQALTVSGLGEGQYSVGWYDAWSSGHVPSQVDSVAVGVGGDLVATIPSPGRGDIACRFMLGALTHPLKAERGVASVGSAWTTVDLTEPFVSPVIVAGPATRNNADPGVIRVRSVGPTSIQIRFQEWNYLDGTHPAEDVQWLAVERGTHDLGGGKTLIADTVDVAGLHVFNPDRVDFSQAFSAPPVVVAQVQTVNGWDAVTDRICGVDAAGFYLAMQEEEAGSYHPSETIGYVAVSEDVMQIGPLACSAGVTDAVVAHKPHILSTGRTQCVVWVEEEQSADAETGHWLPEQVGYIALAGQPPIVADMQTRNGGDPCVVRCSLLAQSFQMEHDVATVGSQWTTVDLANTYLAPIVVAGPPTLNGLEPGVLRVRNVTATSFDVRFREWLCTPNPWHPAEQAHYMVVERGLWDLGDGNIMMADALPLGCTNLASPLLARLVGSFSTPPVIATQQQTANGWEPVTERVSNVTTAGFRVALQEEEALGAHGVEMLGFVAVGAGAGGIPVAAPVGFTASTSAPAGWEVVAQEEQSADTETYHGAETVGVLEFAAGDPPFIATMQTTNDTDTATLRCRSTAGLALSMEREDGTPIAGQVLAVGARAMITSERPVVFRGTAGRHVRLEAPSSVIEAGEALTFSHWDVDGEERDPGLCVIKLRIMGARKAVAVYRSVAAGDPPS